MGTASDVQAPLSADQCAHRLVAALHAPSPAIYWTDLLATAALAWAAFFLAIVAEPWSWPQWLALAAAAPAMYRGLCFVHEISHLRSRVLRGYETTWNLLFGAPLLIPSFAYAGVHRYHHEVATYGTRDDPEYLPFSNSHSMTLVFTAHSILIPLALLFRFLVLAPVSLLVRPLRRWRITHASSLTMNLAFRREYTAVLAAKVRRWEMAVLGIWGAAGWTAWEAGVAGKVFAIWYAIAASASLVNTLRALAAHRYESDGAPRDRGGQLADSLDVPGGVFTGLWAPVGLRYHALHHYFPGIPYHNLGRAYGALTTGLPADAPYRRQTCRSLAESLGGLYRRGKLASRKSASRA